MGCDWVPRERRCYQPNSKRSPSKAHMPTLCGECGLDRRVNIDLPGMPPGDAHRYWRSAYQLGVRPNLADRCPEIGQTEIISSRLSEAILPINASMTDSRVEQVPDWAAHRQQLGLMQSTECMKTCSAKQPATLARIRHALESYFSWSLPRRPDKTVPHRSHDGNQPHQ